MSPATYHRRALRPAGRRRPEGFTLLELLIVAAVLTLLTALSWPSVRRSMSRAEHERAVDEVIQFFQETRSRAIADGQPRLIQLGPMGRRLAVYEAVYDEAGPSYFSASAGNLSPRAAATPDATAPGDRLAAPLGNDAARDPRVQPEAGRDPGDLLPSGVAWRRGATLELAEGLWARVAQEQAMQPADASASRHRSPIGGPGEQGQAPPFGDQSPPGIANPELPDFPDAASRTVRLLVGVDGRTADLQLEILSVSGRVTVVDIDGALGSIRKGATKRRPTTDRSFDEQELMTEVPLP